jgi:glutamate/tyrosine decarboxylase-like PLP-dependent enzyme
MDTISNCIDTHEAAEESLDPEDWPAFRALGHRMLDEMVDLLQGVRERPVWQSPPPEVRARLRQPVPHRPQGLERAYQDFRADVLPYPSGNIHPRFWGWVMGTGTPGAMLAEMLAAGLNSNSGGFDDATSLVEGQVLDWLKDMLGYPAEASGVLVSGGSVANLVGLAVARNVQAGFDVRRKGVAAAPRRPTLYASREVHNSVAKAVELLGLGSDALRLVDVDRDYCIDLRALKAAVAEDRQAGHQPFCVIGCAGTVNTGATDDLEGLADFCAAEGLWLHVDGAFGALAALSPALRPRLRGLARADSLAFDLHKWGYLPYEVGCTLVRHEEGHRRTFEVAGHYLAVMEGGLAAQGRRFAEYGPQLSRGFRALKVWMALKEHGSDKLGRLIEQNVAQAAYLADLVRSQGALELLAPVPLNIVCFRYVGNGAGDLNAVNRRILVRLHESGVAVPSFTTLGERFALRVAIVNHRSRREDFDLLVREVLRLGGELAAEERSHE